MHLGVLGLLQQHPGKQWGTYSEHIDPSIGIKESAMTPWVTLSNQLKLSKLEEKVNLKI